MPQCKSKSGGELLTSATLYFRFAGIEDAALTYPPEALLGLYLPDRGDCRTFGTKTAELSPEDLSRIGYVHQEGSLIDWMTAPQLIRYVAAYYPTWNKELEGEFIERFDVSVNSRVGTMSPGERQKLAILLVVGFEP